LVRPQDMTQDQIRNELRRLDHQIRHFHELREILKPIINSESPSIRYLRDMKQLIIVNKKITKAEKRHELLSRFI
jgi:hypothetical protein